MRRARRFPQRLVRWTSLCVCLALVVSSLFLIPGPFVSGKGSIPSTQPQGNQVPDNGKARRVKPEPPQKGAPAAMLPNLDEVKRRQEPKPEPPAPIPSTMRSKHKPLESRRGRRVGDPGTIGATIGDGTGSGSDRPTSARARRGTAARLHHTRRRARTLAPPPLGDDQFLQNFFYWAFLRYPNSTELAYWDDVLRTAYPQGQTAMLIVMRELGMTVFESAEYAARNRSNHDYVYDLYKTFLMRDPDSGGWAYWDNLAPTIGRENVRHGFEYSVEFSNLVATVTPNGSASGNAASLDTARIDPNNQTGNQLLARDCEWSVGLLGLPGRAGLDLGLGLSYSSLVWTRSGPYLYFDADNGSPSPGFRLGFATIQGAHFDAQVGRDVYMLIAASGHRVELRQIGTSNVYEAGDSSYLQLTDNGGSLLVRTTDGTQMTYLWFENEWRATQIKDRNGNYLTVNYNSQADITNITDTLGRVITFNYDANANPLSITQTWNGQTHTWASFGWGTPLSMNVSGFSGASVVNTYTGESIPVLRQVGLDDGSYFTFEYSGAGLVNMIRRYTSDTIERSHIAYDYNGATDDCPRITQSRVWALDWTGVNGVPYEVTTQFDLPGDGSRRMTAPDGTVYKEFYGTGWQKGLTTQSEVWSGGVRQKWTTTAWTQDSTGVSYQTNPRVTETNIYDSAGNRSRTTIDYNSVTVGATTCHLPEVVRQYAGVNGDQLLRRTVTLYSWDQALLERRVIGLMSRHEIYEGESMLVSRTDYIYDWVSGYMDGTAPAVNHDTANYGTSLGPGRGILVAVFRYNMNDTSQGIWAQTFGYNLAGETVWAADGSGHRTYISYADSFSDGNNTRGTLAYPTTITDPDGFSTSVQYNYDFGARTRAQGPRPAGQSQGAIQNIAYDNAARIQQVTIANTSAYTRYVYGPNYVQSFSTVNSVADDAYSIQIFDGAGRTILAGGYHPGSVGGYRGVWTQYDLMGRVMRQSNPTEITAGWQPSGEDAAGWVFSIPPVYDWKGRPLTTYNQDGTYKTAAYTGCGCAGGEVATLTDEVGRQQKVYSDVLGRTAKTEVLNWDSTVYSTTSNTYNARDQVTQVRQYQGADTSTVYQDITMTYDGYGRLQTKHVPQQNAGTATVYAYNPDNTVLSITDARGALATYTYNGRHLVTNVSQTLSGYSAINVSYGYDAAGNRSSMSHTVAGAAQDSASYTYDQLSRLTSETRHLDALAGYSMGGNFTINYGYTLSGELQSITDPFNSTVNYSYDVAGRTSSITGSAYAGVTSYASNIQYRAWGAVRAATFGDGTSESVPQFNARMQPTQFRLMSGQYSQMRDDYSYFNDGRLKQFMDLDDQVGQPSLVQWHYMSRAYSYDHTGRISSVGQVPSYSPPPPFTGSYGYDAFNNMTSRSGQYALNPNQSDSATYTNNRRNGVGWSYDADGRVTASADSSTNSSRVWTYDAAGEETSVAETISGSTVTNTMAYDGNGQMVYESVVNGGSTTSDYLIRSTVLGALLTKLNASGNKDTTYVPGNGLVTPLQQKDYLGNPTMSWVHRDALNVQEAGRAYDPFGNLISNVQPPSGGPPPTTAMYGPPYGGVSWSAFSNANNFSSGCFSAESSAPGTCSDAMRSFLRDIGMSPPDPGFFGNLPGVHDDMGQGENDHISRLNGTSDDPNNYGSTSLEPTDPNPDWPHYWRVQSVFAHVRHETMLPQNPSEPQGTFDAAYKSCLGTLGNSIAPGLAQAADILMVGNRTGVDPTLLSVTWRFEGGYDQFGFNFQPTNGFHTRNTEIGDVGPGALYPPTWNKSPYTDGLSNPFGTNLNKGQVFNGNAFENLMVAGRALGTAQGAQRANAAGIYRAGSSTNPGYKERVQNFKDNARNYDAFYGCLAKKGFSP